MFLGRIRARATGKRGLRVAALPLLAVALLPAAIVASAQAAPGDLDPSFSRDGLVRTSFRDLGLRGAQIRSIAVQPDGRVLAAGFGLRGERPEAGDFALARYKPNGRLDRTFSGDGRVRTDFGADDRAFGLALQSNGKIVVAGYTDADSELEGRDFALARYKRNGRLDPSFSGNGKLSADLGAFDDDWAFAVALQPDGRIVVAGTTQGFSRDFALARFLPGGSLDASFSGDGRATTDFGDSDGPDAAYSVAIQTDGKIVAAGARGDTGFEADFALARYTSDGSLDPSFSGEGMVTMDISGFDAARDLALYPDGRIVAVGSCACDAEGGSDFALVRYGSDGTLDSTFGGDGTVIANVGGYYDGAWGVALQRDGKVVAAGSGSGFGDFELARFNADGALDATFSEDGVLTTDFFTADDDAYDVAVQRDGRIVAVGWTEFNGRSFALARYRADGKRSDADADGISDSSDRCPGKFSARPSGCLRVRRSLAADYVNEFKAFQGRLSARSARYRRCEREQTVKIFRQRRGPDRKVGVDEFVFGDFSIIEKVSTGRFYAVAPRNFDPDIGTCLRAESKVFVVRR